jgi:hypothetical protein
MNSLVRSAPIVLVLAVLVAYGETVQAASVVPCVGDCQGTGTTGIASLVTIVDIALGTAALSACPHGLPMDGPVTVDLIILAVHNTLSGCPAPEPTATPTATAVDNFTPTRTATAGPAGSTCPAGQHRACHGGSGRGGGYKIICTCVANPPPVCVTASGTRIQAGTSILLYDTTTVQAPDTCSSHATTVSCSSTGILSPPNAVGYPVCTVVPPPTPPDTNDG